MAFPAVPAMGSRRPGGLLNIQSACDGSVLKKCQCSGLGWKVEACARWPGSPRAAGVTRELPPCRHPLQSTPINTAEVPQDVHVFQISLSARMDNILAGRPLVEASIFRQRNVPAASQSTPKGYALPGSRRGHSAQVWQRRAGAAAVPWPWCLRSGRRGQCCPPGHAVVNSRPGGATLRYSAFSAVGPLKIPFSLPSLGKKSCW